ncbi:MAG TPA: Gldg family protein [Puia sp.]|nr:Gldg family protein [Puia sp.]
MKKTLQVALLELSLLFYSPIAWLLMIALFIQMSIVFVPSMAGMEQGHEFLLLYPRGHLPGLTSYILMDTRGGVFGNILSFLYLYMPLLTMGLISRETSSGTINLLYSSPLTIRQIIFGKFLSMMLYNLIIIGLMLIFAFGTALFVIHFDYPHLLVGLLGVYLLLCTYSAIGLFMSCLTGYPVVAAILTFVVLAFFNYVGGFFQGTDFVRDLTHSLWITERPLRILHGMLTTREVMYFLAICYIFIALSISRLRMARDSRRLPFHILRYTLIIASGITITYLTSRPGYIGYYDATRTKENTLSKNSQDILKKMGDAPIEVTEYINYLGDGYQNAAPDRRIEDIDRWEPYIRFKSNIHLNWIYYYDSLTFPSPLYKDNPGKTLKQIFDQNIKFSGLDPREFMTPEEIRKIDHLGDEGNRVVMRVRYKDKTTWLRTFADPTFWPTETEISAALKRMITPLPRIAFVNDGYERDIEKMGDRDYKVLTNWKIYRQSLINQGFDADTLSLSKEEIPPGIAALVIADPRVSLDTAAISKLQRYIDAGGNLFIAGEPGKQSVDNPLMHTLGVRLADGTIVQRSKDFSFGLVTPWLTPAADSLSRTMHYVRRDSIPVTMPGVAGLAYDHTGPFAIKPFLLTDPTNSWSKMGAFVLDSAAPAYSAVNGDQKGVFPTALSLTRTINGKEQRILLTGDADFMSNAELSRNNMTSSNFLFSDAIFGWFAYGEFPVQTTRPRPTDDDITLSAGGVKVLRVVYFGLIPGLFLLAGTIILIRRKRK